MPVVLAEPVGGGMMVTMVTACLVSSLISRCHDCHRTTGPTQMLPRYSRHWTFYSGHHSPASGQHREHPAASSQAACRGYNITVNVSEFIQGDCMLDGTDNILNITKPSIHKSIIHSQIFKRRYFRKTI